MTLGTALVFREPLRARQAAALALAVGGSALVAGIGGGAAGAAPTAGILLSLGAAVAFSVYVVAGQGALARHDPLAVGGYSMLGCALLFLVLRTAGGGEPPPIGPLLRVAALMALLATALPLVLLLAGIRRLGATRTAVVGSAEPVFTAGLLALTLGERLSAPQGLGILAIVAGVVLVSAGGSEGRRRAGTGAGAGGPDCP